MSSLRKKPSANAEHVALTDQSIETHAVRVPVLVLAIDREQVITRSKLRVVLIGNTYQFEHELKIVSLGITGELARVVQSDVDDAVDP